MKIALISGTAVPTDGWGSFTHHYAAALAGKGVDFQLFLPHDHPLLDVPWKDRVSRSLPKAHLRYGQMAFLSTALHRTGRFKGYDLIHSLFATPGSYLAYKAARAHDIPLIVGAQGTYGIMPFLRRFDRLVFEKILAYADRLVLPSRFVKSVILNFHRGWELGRKSVLIPNGIDSSNFHRDSHGDAGSYRKSEFEFVGLGGLKARKGFDVVIRALAIVEKTHPNVSYHIIGGGPEKYKRYLENEAKKAGVADKVRFLGVLDDHVIAGKLRESFAYIHTPVARDWRLEGFGMVYLEANACGIPSIGSYSGGVPDAVRDGFSGLLCEEDDPLSTAQCMMRLIEDRPFYARLCRNALEWGSSHGWEHVALQFLRLYQQVLSEKGRGTREIPGGNLQPPDRGGAGRT